MTDPSKRYWITEQGVKEAAAEIIAGKGRCPICSGPLAENRCVLGNCSHRSNLEVEQGYLRRKREKWEEALKSIAAHSEAASPPTKQPEHRLSDEQINEMLRDWYKKKDDPCCPSDPYILRVLLEVSARRISEAAAPPRGTPAPEPDKCPECLSAVREIELWPCTERLKDSKPHPWHSTIAAEKGR